MNEHLQGTETLLSLSLAGLTEERAALINQLAGDTWDFIREFTEEHKLDLRELFAISLTTHLAVTGIIRDELEEN